MKTLVNLNPKVSLIIPVYNGSDYLKEAIDSALAQTYKNLEVIVVNDGSSDNGETENIALSYGDKISYFFKSNGGVASALNFAIRQMTGEYFSWLSHDDTYLPEKLESQISLLSTLDPNTIIYSAYEMMDTQGNIVCSIKPDEILSFGKWDVSLCPLLRGLIHGCSLLIPKKYFHEIGFFDESLLTTQDYALWFKMLRVAPIKLDRNILVRGRLHPNQGTHKIASHKEENVKLWAGFIKSLTLEEMKIVDDTPYLFLRNIATFLKTIPCDACKAAEIRAKNILDNTKISVIMPIYNRTHFIRESVESVLKQTHKNLELILVDDASDNNTLELINLLIKKDNRIKYIRLEKNSGAGAARNIGIKNATGEYIAFIDSDDLFIRNKLESQLQYMEANNISFCHTSYQKINLNGEFIEDVNSAIFNGHVFPRIISQCIIATPTVMGKASIFYNDNFSENMRIGEDVCLWISLASKYKLGGLESCLSQVRIDYTSSCAYNPRKLSIGLTNIASFVINSKEFSSYSTHVMCLLLEVISMNKNPPTLLPQAESIISENNLNILSSEIITHLQKMETYLNTFETHLNTLQKVKDSGDRKRIRRLVRSLRTDGFVKTCYKICYKVKETLLHALTKKI